MSNTRIPVALTMYTVRDDAAKDYLGTVGQVAEMGYMGIQTHYKITDPAELRKLCNSLGIAIVGVHAGFDALRNELDDVVRFNQELECMDVTCSSITDDYRNADGYKKAGEILTEIGEKLMRSGIRLTYHNHSFEFEQFDGKTGFDILFDSADADLVQSELDVYWVKHGGQDPVRLIRRFSSRLPLVHIKDMADGEERLNMEIGDGILDWKGIFEASSIAGVEWMIVEMDTCVLPPLDSARKSIQNLRKMGYL